MKDGVIADFTVHRADAEALHQEGARLAHAAARARASSSACRAARPRSSAARSANRRKAPARATSYLIEEPMAAAIGAGLPVHEARGSMVLDIGGGTSEVAVISLERHRLRAVGAHRRRPLRRGDHQLRAPQLRHADRRGDRRAHQDRDRLGVSRARGARDAVKGRNLSEGVPRSFTLNSNEILEALHEPLQSIVSAVKRRSSRRRPSSAPTSPSAASC